MAFLCIILTNDNKIIKRQDNTNKMDKLLLIDIKKAEEEAESIIKKAENEKLYIIEKMKKESLKFYDNKINELNNKRNKKPFCMDLLAHFF